MKNARPAYHETSANLTIGSVPPNKETKKTHKFIGIKNPRYERVLLALLVRSMRREDVDRVAGCSNGPDLIAQLRHLGLAIPCTRIDALDRDGRPCRPGVYHLTDSDRKKTYRWFQKRSGA